MIATLLILSQLTLLLAIALAVSLAFRGNASRAHRVLLAGLVCLFVLPAATNIAGSFGWGLFPDSMSTARSSLDSRVPTEAAEPHPTEAFDDDNQVDSSGSRTFNTDAPPLEIPPSSRISQNASSLESLIPGDSLQPALAPRPGALRTLPPNPDDQIHNVDDVSQRATMGDVLKSIGWQSDLLAAWGLCSIFVFGRLILGSWRAFRIVRLANPVSEEQIIAAAEHAKLDMEIGGKVILLSSPQLPCPVIWTWGTPTIVIPNDSFTKDVDWRAIFTHELAHLKRRDQWSTLLAEFARCLLPWHPLVSYCCHRMDRLSEMACDAWAIRFSCSPERYAESLLEFSPTPRRVVFSSMASSDSNLGRRVNHLLSGGSHNPRPGIAFTSAICVMATIFVSLTALIRTYEPVPATIPQVINDAQEDEDDQDSRSDEEWIKQLVNVPESARWFVGKNLGYQLSQLPNGRGFLILNSCWDQIAVSVRQQILKGYYPDEKINSHFFQVMNLGMTSNDAGIRQFAATYLKQVVFRDFEDDLETYGSWYSTVKGQASDEVVAAQLQAFLDEAKNKKTRNVRKFLRILDSNAALISRNEKMRNVFLENGLEQLLSDWQKAGFLPPEHKAFTIAKQLRRSSKPSELSQESVTIDSTDDEWTEHLIAIPDSANWSVGANIGIRMSSMPGERALAILKGCWTEIQPSVRCQILKGLTPGFGATQTSDRYLEILELGIKSEDKRVRSFASTYLEGVAFKKISNGSEYDHWRLETKGKTLREIRAGVCQDIVADIDSLDTIGLEARFKKYEATFRNNHEFEQMLMETNLAETLERRLLAGDIPITSSYTIQFALDVNVSAESRQALVRSGLEALVEDWERYASREDDESNELLNYWTRAQNFAKLKDPHVIPILIGIIDADNHYETVYGFGYFGLAEITGVKYSSTHDGAWWRRWWEKNMDSFPLSVQQVPIPDLTKSMRGRNYEPYPENIDTFDRAIAWLLKKQRAGEEYDAALDLLAEHIKDPRAIPTLIGVMDADNSSRTISSVGRCLRDLAGAKPDGLADGPWWRQWWKEHKADFPQNVQDIEIPDLPKTEHGKTYVSTSTSLKTIDDKIDLLRKPGLAKKQYDRLINSLRQPSLDHDRAASDIPKLIGVIDSDNSYQTIYGIGYFGLSRVTGVSYSPLHDGAWWKRWWEKNKGSYPEDVRDTEIPVLPKTEYGKSHIPFPDGLDTVSGKINQLGKISWPDDVGLYKAIIGSLDDLPDEEWKDSYIPGLIGVIDADNSYDTTYSIGHYALGKNVGVEYNPMHDGAWWRRWWARNKSKYPQDVQAIPIPSLSKSPHGKTYRPMPAELDTFEGKVAWMKEGCPSPASFSSSYLSSFLFENQDPRSIPIIIGWMLAEGSTEAIGHREDNFERVTGVEVTREQTPEWWQTWWNNNKTKFPRAAEELAPPDFTEAVAKFKAAKTAQQQEQLDESEFNGYPSTLRMIGSDDKKIYFQIGPKDGATQPDDGWKVLMILPGGDASAEFNPWCRRIHKNALPDGYIALQLVAPDWTSDDNRVVWPTEKLKPNKAKFTTERFIKDVIGDISTHVKINDRYVFALGWSSGGPAVYANSVSTDSPVTGSFVAMSVFHPQQMPNLERAKGHPYYILHSPQDWIKIDQHAEKAVAQLGEVGAKVHLETYEGGHGWRDDPFGNIKAGVTWLEANAK